ncbi:transcriptional regulator, LysR family [Halothece sp. PCC 7418]|uniref:LysR family transcriptional regulator n=1 Tax=Halothece sp. (strain PCC 7418) TaxID=65093 RepID=UPI0002A05DB2|nr:LysR family transcriptional regulator [Halothece sp. PCC 7418]AFZ45205.1 transcriptional regulator, LysR family [Halothece sp. PCC 7418]
MTLPNIKISQLRALVAVAQHQNFSQAALDLNVSQSGISHAIASLEEELGVQLLHRGRHGAKLTAVGEQIVKHAETIFSSISDIVSTAQHAKGLDGGSVCIATFRSLATNIIPEILVQFRAQFPNIKVSIAEYEEATELEQALHQGSADISLSDLLNPQNFDCFELLRDEYIVLLPPNTVIPEKVEKLTWEELASFPLILPNSQSCSKHINPYIQDKEIPLEVAYRIRGDSTIISLVKQGLGAAILPRLAAEPIPDSICAYHLPIPLERVIHVAMRKDAMHTPATYAFLETLRDFKH